MFGNAKHPGSPDFSLVKEHLSSVPVPNHEVEITKSREDEVFIVDVQLKYKGLQKFFAKLLKLRDLRRFQLDGVGLELYKLMDGKRTIEDLVDYLGEKYNLSFFESRGLVLQYIHTLTQRGVIVVVVQKREE